MKRFLNLSIVLLVFLLFSCSSSHSSNDTDTIPNSDADTQDSETQDDDSDSQSSEIVDDSDEIPDQDNDENAAHDADHNIIPDTDSDENVACLDLRYNENTIKTPFPFKDANGKPTFCRPGCDTPTENDPQCVRNIWEWDNWDEYQVYLNAQAKDPNQTKERECYPWPCKLPNMHAKTKAELSTFVSSCDRLLTVNGFNADEGTVWSHGMFDGVVGTDFGHTGRAIEYDPERDEYLTLGQERRLAFNEGRYVIESYDRIPAQYPTSRKFFAISILKTDDGYFYELINTNYGEFSDPPFAGKNWVVLRLSDNRTMYASSKDWKWYFLSGINNYAGEGNIVGDHLTFITNNRELYYCDLRKYPRHIDDCFKLNRKNEFGEEELGHSPRIDLDNEYRVVYNLYRQNIFVEVDLHDLDNPKYTEYTFPKRNENSNYWEIDMLKGSMISYSDTVKDDIGCFYRFDKQKTYCQQEHTFSTDPADLMGYNVFWGKWHMWKRIGRPTAIIRNFECYCVETGICPLEQ